MNSQTDNHMPLQAEQGNTAEVDKLECRNWSPCLCTLTRGRFLIAEGDNSIITACKVKVHFLAV